MANTQVAVRNSNTLSIFSNGESWELATKMAASLAKSTIVPKDFQQNANNALIAIELANRLQTSPLMVMQNLYVVYGRPSWSAQYMIAMINYPVVNHKDENKKNNEMENLEWCSCSYNSTYRSARKNVENKHKKPIIKVDSTGNTVAEYDSITSAAIAMGGRSKRSYLNNACLGKMKTAYGFVWKYKEKMV